MLMKDPKGMILESSIVEVCGIVLGITQNRVEKRSEKFEASNSSERFQPGRRVVACSVFLLLLTSKLLALFLEALKEATVAVPYTVLSQHLVAGGASQTQMSCIKEETRDPRSTPSTPKLPQSENTTNKVSFLLSSHRLNDWPEHPACISSFELSFGVESS